MLTRTFTATMVGLNPIKIEVEIDTTPGLPGFILIGLPSQAVEESKERITAALNNCGIRIKAKRTIVNLAPADLRKTGSAFELAIAIGLLKLYGEIPANTDNTIFLGELSLTGAVKAIKGALPLVLAAKQMGFQQIFIPSANAQEVSIVSGISIYSLDHIQTYLNSIKRNKKHLKLEPQTFPTYSSTSSAFDLSEIIDQSQAKRALEIAAAGGHNLHLVGPPGTGKSMLAQAITSILPPLTETEAIELTTIHSVAGLTQETGLITTRPFRTVHHTTSQVGLIGGGSQLSPGQISLAHRGVLFLDEFPEFSRFVLEALRQPLENKTVTISRAKGTVQYPANFTLITAANPCPCGFWGSQKKACSCSEFHRQAYASKISGPLLDRIDLHVWVGEVNLEKIARYDLQSRLNLPTHQLESPVIRERVIRARQTQHRRLSTTGLLTNSDLTAPDIRKFCHLTADAQQLLLKASNKLHLSARMYYKIIKISQTIADLEDASEITSAHVAEALQYRPQVTI